VSRSQRLLVASAIAVVVGAAVGVVAAAWIGSSGGSSAVATSSLKPLTNTSTPPPPPSGAVVLARELGTRAVALAVGPGRELTATVLTGVGGGESGLDVSFRVGGTTIQARPCGPGCYRATAPNGSPRSVDIRVAGGTTPFQIPKAAPKAAAIVRRAGRVFRRLHTLVYLESLRSKPNSGILTRWRFAAPNRMSYVIRGGASAVVIGERRWDRIKPGGGWTRSSQIPALTVPQPTWGRGTMDARLLARSSVDGRPVWIVSFADPTIPAWFTAWIDRSSYRTLRLRMTAAGHFMFHRYLQFNRPLRIVPPTG
jgi:hypothetical protein